jgi:hypothetical protein
MHLFFRVMFKLCCCFDVAMDSEGRGWVKATHKGSREEWGLIGKLDSFNLSSHLGLV